MADNERSVKNIAWLAGLLEGEGCFYAGTRKVGDATYRRVALQLLMTDLCPVKRAADLMRVPWVKSKRITKGGKPLYRTNAHGRKAAQWMMTLYPLMGERRQAKIRECLDVWMKQKTYAPRAEGVA